MHGFDCGAHSIVRQSEPTIPERSETIEFATGHGGSRSAGS